jgi:phage shock protein PspC (stress-responsive transcriptional regulator)
MAINIARSGKHKIIAGVLGGIGVHFGWNIAILRLLFVLLSIVSAAFPGVIVYLVLWMIMPNVAAVPNNSAHGASDINT